MRKNIYRRLTNPTKEDGVRIGNVSKMIGRLEDEQPGAGHWLLDQVPKDANVADVIFGLALDAFLDEKEAKSAAILAKVRAKQK